MKSPAVHVSRDPLASVDRKRADNLGMVWYELPTVLNQFGLNRANTAPLEVIKSEILVVTFRLWTFHFRISL